MKQSKFLDRIVKKFKRVTKQRLSLNEFSSQLDLLFVDLISGVKEETIDTMIDLYEDIVEATPVDTGIAQANWQIDDIENTNFLHKDLYENKNDRKFSDKLTRSVPRPNRPNPSSFYNSPYLLIFNNAPYIDELEGGSSLQAPAGTMIAKNVIKHKLLYEQKLKSTGLFV